MSTITLTLDRVRATGIVAVVRAPSADDALRVTDALVAGGVTGIEITFTTPDAVDAIRRARRDYGESIVLGAGTVTSTEHVHLAVDAGADFLVSPGSPKPLVVEMAASRLLTMAGAITPTEVMIAREAGAHLIKLFPAGLGGIPHLRALRGPFPDLAVVPTGGIKPGNAMDWFAAGAVAIGVGGDLVPNAAIEARDWGDITHRARCYREAIA